MATDKHDLLVFLEQLGHDLASEYNRIYARVSEDPGTAGDQGEENWAELLRCWLPGDYQIVTKGRIINERGAVSPQIDILILDKNYPRGLLQRSSIWRQELSLPSNARQRSQQSTSALRSSAA